MTFKARGATKALTKNECRSVARAGPLRPGRRRVLVTAFDESRRHPDELGEAQFEGVEPELIERPDWRGVRRSGRLCFVDEETESGIVY